MLGVEAEGVMGVEEVLLRRERSNFCGERARVSSCGSAREASQTHLRLEAVRCKRDLHRFATLHELFEAR